MSAYQFLAQRRRIQESERLVAGWRELISEMQANGRDVTIARELLRTFEADLEKRRLNGLT